MNKTLSLIIMLIVTAIVLEAVRYFYGFEQAVMSGLIISIAILLNQKRYL